MSLYDIVSGRMNPYDMGLSVFTMGVSVGTMLMILRWIWFDLRSSLSIVTEMKIALEELEIRVRHLDEALEILRPELEDAMLKRSTRE
jgi:hypothetical protein